jgi:hypothetical protein
MSLNCDSVLTKPIDIDWAEALGDDCEGYTIYEAADCCGCGREVVCLSPTEDEHRYLEDTITLTEMPENGSDFVCIECGETFKTEIDHPGSEDGECFTCPRCGAYHALGEELTNGCAATVHAEGPMMNYWYPLPNFDGDAHEAARAISHLPLCLVEFHDGSFGLALTGGGMDLSWEICAGYMALGYMPPLHFCDLPKMAGKSAENFRPTIEACLESARTAARWASRTASRLEEYLAELEDETEAKSA